MLTYLYASENTILNCEIKTKSMITHETISFDQNAK